MRMDHFFHVLGGWNLDERAQGWNPNCWVAELVQALSNFQRDVLCDLYLHGAMSVVSF